MRQERLRPERSVQQPRLAYHGRFLATIVSRGRDCTPISKTLACRKQAYLRDLEEWCNKRVRLGTKATMEMQVTAEMQAAARPVKAEDVLLRKIQARSRLPPGCPLHDVHGSPLTEVYGNQQSSHQWQLDGNLICLSLWICMTSCATCAISRTQ